MKAMILAAGYGERLQPLTHATPKVLVPLLGVPLLERLVAYLRHGGVTALALNAHHLADAVTESARALSAARPDLPPIEVFVERELLGTGGGVCNAAPFWGDDPLLVWNGDIVAELKPAPLLEAHRAGGALATLVTQQRPSDSLLLVDEGGWVCGIDSARRGERRLVRDPAGTVSGWAFNGISVLSPALREGAPATGPFDLVELLLQSIAAGGAVRAYDAGGGFWGTTGTVERLAACEAGLTAHPALLARWSPEPTP